MEKTSVSYVDNLHNEDHLHIRGENTGLPSIDDDDDLGSPPHTWRKLIKVGVKFCTGRITSTYVEKTNADSVKANGRKDHLHIRGENQC